MPDKDYTKEMKQLLGEDLITGDDAEIKRKVMEIAGGRDLDEVSSSIRVKLGKLSDKERELKNTIKEKEEELEREYNSEVSTANNNYDNAVISYNYDISIIEAADKVIKKREAYWNSKVSGTVKDAKGKDIPSIETVKNKIIKEQKELYEEDGRTHLLSETETYLNLPEKERNVVSSYISQIEAIEAIHDYEYKYQIYKVALSEKEEAIKKAEETFKDKKAAIEEKAEFIQTQQKSVKNADDLFLIQDYQTKVLPKAEAVTKDTLTPEGKERGLDLLAEARAEYRNKYNGWQRMWANILPASVYGPAKDVERINAYKKALAETGVEEKEIKDADPEKNGRYTKDQDGKLVKAEKAGLLPQEKNTSGRNMEKTETLQQDLGRATTAKMKEEKGKVKEKEQPALNKTADVPKK